MRAIHLTDPMRDPHFGIRQVCLLVFNFCRCLGQCPLIALQ